MIMGCERYGDDEESQAVVQALCAMNPKTSVGDQKLIARSTHAPPPAGRGARAFRFGSARCYMENHSWLAPLRFRPKRGIKKMVMLTLC
jgi:hypothetical protein